MFNQLFHIPPLLGVSNDGSALVVLGIFVIIYFCVHQRNKMVHDNIRRLIESGQPVTPEAIAALKSSSGYCFPNFTSQGPSSQRAQRDLRNGILLTCIGVGLVMFIHGPGWIVLAIGVAHLILARMDRSKDSDSMFTTVFKGANPVTPPPVTPAPAASVPPAATPAQPSVPPVQPPPPPQQPEQPLP